MHRTARNRLVNVEVAVTDLYIEATGGVSTGPGLEIDGSTLAAEVRKWHQVPQVALLALRKIIHHDHFYLPRKDALLTRKYSSGLFAMTSKKVKVSR
jgi:hypothetical protein